MLSRRLTAGTSSISGLRRVLRRCQLVWGVSGCRSSRVPSTPALGQQRWRLHAHLRESPLAMEQPSTQHMSSSSGPEQLLGGQQAGAEAAGEALQQGAPAAQENESVSEQGQQQPRQKLSKKEKRRLRDPEMAKQADVFRGIQMCARSGDLHAAMGFLAEAQAMGMRLQLSSFNSLLYVAVGGDRWEELARQGPPDVRAVENVRSAGGLPTATHTSSTVPSSAPAAGSLGAAAHSGGDASGNGGGFSGGVGVGGSNQGEHNKRERSGESEGSEGSSGQGDAHRVGSGSSPAGEVAGPGPGSAEPPAKKKRGRPPSQKTLAARAAAEAEAAQRQQQQQQQQGQQQQGAAVSGLSAGEGPGTSGAVVEQGSGAGAAAGRERLAVGSEGMQAERAARVEAASKVWDALQQSGVKPDAGTYLALARMEGVRGDPDAALNWVKTCASKGQQVQLRMVHPALVGYCMCRDSAKAMEVDAFLTAQSSESLDRTEYEYARLIEALASDPSADWATLQGVLLRLSADMNELHEPTVQLLEAFFSGSLGWKALSSVPGYGQDGGPQQPMQWKVDTIEVDENGYSPVSGGRLRVIDLSNEDWENFRQGVVALAKKQERPGKNDFEKYMEWEARNGPYNLFIDAANVAFYGQNFEGGGFNWGQVMRMVKKVDKEHPDRKLLVMVHKRRIMDPSANTPEVQAFLEGLRKRRAFYYTPIGSYDDWYWLYAAVRARHKGLLVSNDLLRDHIFRMLRPKHFLKWKARHIVQYRFAKFDDKGEPSLIYPPAYTSCVQQLRNSAWMIPCWVPSPEARQQEASAQAAAGLQGSSDQQQQGDKGHDKSAAHNSGEDEGMDGANGHEEPVPQGQVKWLCARPVPLQR